MSIGGLIGLGGCSQLTMPDSSVETFGPPVNLRCEYAANPLGIDTLVPRLSWEVNDSRLGAAEPRGLDDPR